MTDRSANRREREKERKTFAKNKVRKRERVIGKTVK